jgi:transcription termination/antitermination protein NusG
MAKKKTDKDIKKQTDVTAETPQDAGTEDKAVVEKSTEKAETTNEKEKSASGKEKTTTKTESKAEAKPENTKADEDTAKDNEGENEDATPKDKSAKAGKKKPKKDGVVVINPDIPDTAHWYVVHTYSGHENKVANTLKQAVEARGFTNKIFKMFIPQQNKIVVSDGKKRNVEERLFPGYMMVQMLLDDDSWYIVRSTQGVTGFVGMGNTPTPLPESEVASLMRFAEMEAPKFEAKFRVGDSVKIREGPFKEFLGKVDEVNDDQGKVKVLVSVFGRETPVELDFEQIVSL